MGESDSYASAIGRPDRDDRIVAVAIARASRLRKVKALCPHRLSTGNRERAEGRQSSRRLWAAWRRMRSGECPPSAQWRATAAMSSASFRSLATATSLRSTSRSPHGSTPSMPLGGMDSATSWEPQSPERDVLVRDRRPTAPDHRGPDRPHRDLALHPAGRERPGSSRTAGGGEYGWQAVPPAARSLHYRPSHARSFDARPEMDRHRRGTPRPSAR